MYNRGIRYVLISLLYFSTFNCKKSFIMLKRELALMNALF